MDVAQISLLKNKAVDKIIELVDRGRGLQLSTSRVTVQDLVPYFQEGCSSDEIIRWIPTLTHEEIAVIERYYREHKEELDEQDRCIRERSAQRKNPPWVEEIAAQAERSASQKLKRCARPKRMERRSEGNHCRHQHSGAC